MVENHTKKIITGYFVRFILKTCAFINAFKQLLSTHDNSFTKQSFR